MSIKEDKAKILKLYKSLILNYHKSLKSKDLTSHYLEKIKLTNKDYENLKKLFNKEKNYKVFKTETEQIIKTLKKKLINYKIEYDANDLEPIIYFHTDNNKTYLVNYDSIENKWYLSLVETSSFTLIEEIYSSEYASFLDYIKKIKGHINGLLDD